MKPCSSPCVTVTRSIVTRLDRLARSVIHLGQIVERLQEAGADLQIVAMGVDTSTATGKLMLNVLGVSLSSNAR